VCRIVTNSTYKLANYADVLYAVDFQWWRHNIDDVRESFMGDVWTQDVGAAERFNLNLCRGCYREGLGENVIHTAGNSGHGAINLAYLFGARRILLLGFDMREVDGRKHWHPDHPAPLVQKQQFGEWIHKFKKTAEDAKRLGVEIINCTPGSALPWFPMSTIEQELP